MLTRYSNSVRPSVCVSRSGIASKGLNISSYFLHGSPVILVFPILNISAKFRRGYPYTETMDTLNTGSMKNRDFRPISHFISDMIKDGAIVTMERQQELVCNLPNGAIFSYLSDFCRSLQYCCYFVRSLRAICQRQLSFFTSTYMYSKLLGASWLLQSRRRERQVSSFRKLQQTMSCQLRAAAATEARVMLQSKAFYNDSYPNRKALISDSSGLHEGACTNFCNGAKSNPSLSSPFFSHPLPALSTLLSHSCSEAAHLSPAIWVCGGCIFRQRGPGPSSGRKRIQVYSVPIKCVRWQRFWFFLCKPKCCN